MNFTELFWKIKRFFSYAYLHSINLSKIWLILSKMIWHCQRDSYTDKNTEQKTFIFSIILWLINNNFVHSWWEQKNLPMQLEIRRIKKSNRIYRRVYSIRNEIGPITITILAESHIDEEKSYCLKINPSTSWLTIDMYMSIYLI